MCFDLTHAPVATTARAAATGPVSMSTRPDPEGSDTVEIATRRCQYSLQGSARPCASCFIERTGLNSEVKAGPDGAQIIPIDRLMEMDGWWIGKTLHWPSADR